MNEGKTAVWTHAHVQLYWYSQYNKQATGESKWLWNKLKVLLQPKQEQGGRWWPHAICFHVACVKKSHQTSDILLTGGQDTSSVVHHSLGILSNPPFYSREQLLCWWSGLGVVWGPSVWMHVCLGWVGLGSCCVDMCLRGEELSLVWWHLHCECDKHCPLTHTHTHTHRHTHTHTHTHNCTSIFVSNHIDKMHSLSP